MECIKKVSLNELLNIDFNIPLYQRPYEWTRSNVLTLLDDIYKAFNNKKIFKDNLNLGTIILLKNETGKFDIIDGQQRLITLSLLCNVLSIEAGSKILEMKIINFSNVEKRIISNNYEIKQYIERLKNDNKFPFDSFKKFILRNINFYVLYAIDENEAFQLFDGRNYKYKSLNSVDLLKAYHLRAINNKNDKKYALEIWNNNINIKKENQKKYIDIDEIKQIVFYKNNIQYLFEDVLFNIYNWSLNKDRKDFETNEINIYKGYKNNEKYNYINYYKTTDDNIFLINKPFKEGISFFKMIDYYINEYLEIIKSNNLYLKVLLDSSLSDKEYKKSWFNYDYKYIQIVYYDAIFMFENKFGKLSNFEKNNILDYIYKWVMIHRINGNKVSYSTINKYILDNKNQNFFFECQNSLKIEDLYKLEYPEITEKEPSFSKDDSPLQETRSKLWKKLKD